MNDGDGDTAPLFREKIKQPTAWPLNLIGDATSCASHYRTRRLELLIMTWDTIVPNFHAEPHGLTIYTVDVQHQNIIYRC